MINSFSKTFVTFFFRRNVSRISQQSVHNSSHRSLKRTFCEEVKQTPEKYSKEWFWDKAVIFCVFGLTGTTTVFVVKPSLRKFLGMEGSLRKGNWQYRVAYFILITPLYPVLLITFGTLFGRGPYFRSFAKNMWKRFIPMRFLNKYFKSKK